MTVSKKKKLARKGVGGGFWLLVFGCSFNINCVLCLCYVRVILFYKSSGSEKFRVERF